MKEKLEKIEKKKLILAGSFLLMIIIILLGGSLIYNKFFYKRSFSEIENILLTSTKNYTSKNKDILPKQINETITISANELIKAEEMKEFEEYTKDESISCSGNVTITNINNTYRYTPTLDCGTSYKTKKFIEYIKEKNPIVESGNGLYNMNEELVFRGDNINNYLKLAGKLYSIVKFTNDETVIINTEKLDKTIWDDRYNQEKNSTVGINDYSVSKIRDFLNDLYKNNSILKDKKNNIDVSTLVIAHNLNFGKRSSKDTEKNGELEKSAILENQFIGLLPLNDYLNASLDKNCTTSISASCMNYNYLSKYQKAWWTMTATSLNSYNVYKIESSPKLTAANNSACPRYVLHLAKDAIYVSGDGTKENPYIVK